MIDHAGFAMTNLGRSRAFYEAALRPLGIEVIMDVPGATGFGESGRPFFWISQGDRGAEAVHIAFTAADRASVDRFYEAAIAAGGIDNGPPGIREHYHPNYYAAFALDPDGHNVEAVCHRPE